MTEAFYNHLAKTRHQIHQHPEVSEEEHETTVFLKVALHQSVDQAGAADQPHLSDRQGQGRTLDLAVQPAFGKQPVKAGGVCQLAGQLVFIEHSPPECLHLFGDCRELIAGLGQKVGGR